MEPEAALRNETFDLKRRNSKPPPSNKVQTTRLTHDSLQDELLSPCTVTTPLVLASAKKSLPQQQDRENTNVQLDFQCQIGCRYVTNSN
jgi:hypothetical protein